MKLKVIYEDENLLVIDKPAGVIVFPENQTKEKTLIDYLLVKFPFLKNVGEEPRHGIVHRLDKETSGILLVAKNNKALNFLQNEFKENKVLKKYLALVIGNFKINQGEIETLIGRSLKDRKKQKVFSIHGPEVKRKGLRIAITEYRVLQRFSAKGGSAGGGKDYTLIEAIPKTGRKHQIRCHLAYLGHPIAGDRIYGFKNQPKPENLKRHFLHAAYLKIKLPDGKAKVFKLDLPADLKEALKNLKNIRI